MKTTLLVALTLAWSLTALAQNATYKYHFNGTLNEMYNGGPMLKALCPGTYATESLPIGLSKKTYRFDKGCGLFYNDVGKNFLASGSYTIELYFRLDTISGYKKLIDFDSLKADAGLYNQSGKIVLYAPVTSVDSFIGANVYQYVAITRDGTTKKMYINANGKTAAVHTDNTNVYVPGTDKMLIFFRDDNSTSTEQSKGAVAMIQISNYAQDSNTIKNNYSHLVNTLDVAGTTLSNKVAIYPNPTNGNIHVTAPANCNYSICDITGRTIKTGALQQGDNSIVLDHLSTGLYLLKMKSIDGAEQQVYRLIRQ